jgi:hypothetical protein
MGMVMMAMVWRTGSLAAAMGFHFINNIGALTVAGADQGPSSIALFVWSPAQLTASASSELLIIGLLAGVCLFTVRAAAERSGARPQEVKRGLRRRCALRAGSQPGASSAGSWLPVSATTSASGVIHWPLSRTVARARAETRPVGVRRVHEDEIKRRAPSPAGLGPRSVAERRWMRVLPKS